MDRLFFQKALISWYNDNKRDLPWRDTKDPYKIWLSEIILQQTRISQGLPYYKAFTNQFPKIEKLAEADESQVLRLWQGLGYYTRARNLHTCAKQIVNIHKGHFPKSYKSLLALQGIGPYTAAAIASFAFDKPYAVVDGNVFRVLSRVFGIEYDIKSSKGQRFFQNFAQEIINKKDPSTHNQAIMEFGALQCTPKQPACFECVLKERCYANLHKKQNNFPVKSATKKPKKRFFHYFVVGYNNSYIMTKRTKQDIWKGLFDFPLIETNEQQEFEQLPAPILPSLNKKNIHLKHISPIYKHILSHQHIFARFYHLLLDSETDQSHTNNYSFFSIQEIDELPKPILIENFLRDNFF